MSKDQGETLPPQAFHPALVRQLVSRHLQHQETSTTPQLPTLTAEAADAVGELLKQFVLEARNRAAMVAEIEQEVATDNNDGVVQIRSDHCTQIAAEMLLDFS